MSERDKGTEGALVNHGRWERALMRHPKLALPGLRAGMGSSDPGQARAALLGAFFVLERWGRGAELQDDLQAALKVLRGEVAQQRRLNEAAEFSEALARLHYQRGDYVQACQAWSETLDWADDDSRPACQARIGLAHLCYALGEWARGGRVLDQAELHYARLPQDPYLRAKIALNRAASLRATQGPQAARVVLEDALAAAREAGHADYQAEALWHQARCARDSGDAALALKLAHRVLESSQRCGYRWLYAQAALLLCEVNTGEAAVGWAGQALSLAEALQSRHLQAAAHGRLAELMREQGELGPAWHHQQQRQRLESTLNQSQLPTQLELLARFDTDPHGADALLLSLSSQAWPQDDLDEFQRQWQALRPRLSEAFGLSGLALQWTRWDEQAGPTPATRVAEPETGRLVLPLQIDGQAAGELRLWRPARTPWSRADTKRATRLAHWLEGVMARMEQSLQDLEARAADRARLQSLERLMAAHLAQLSRSLSHVQHAPALMPEVLPETSTQVAALQRYLAVGATPDLQTFNLSELMADVQAVHAPLLQAAACTLTLDLPTGLRLTQARAWQTLLVALLNQALGRGARELSLGVHLEQGQILCLQYRDDRSLPQAELPLLRWHARALNASVQQLKHGGLDLRLPTASGH